MDPRTGKSLTSAWWLLGQPQPPCSVLVVTRKSIVDNWQADLASIGLASTVAVGGAEKASAAMDPQGWTICNRESLWQRVPNRKKAIASPLAMHRWDAVVLDESTAFSSPSAVVTRIALQWLKRARLKAVLTGLPDPERPEQHVCPMLFLHGTFMGCRDFWSWRLRNQYRAGFDWAMKKGAEEKLMQAVADGGAIYVTEKDAGMRIKRVREKFLVTLPPKVVKAIKQGQRDAMIGHPMKPIVIANEQLSPLHWSIQLAGGSFRHSTTLQHTEKLKSLIDFLDFTHQLGTIVAFRYNDEIAMASRYLTAARIKHDVVTGETKMPDRKNIFARYKFKANTRGRVLLAQSSVIQMGMDFAGAGALVFFSNYHNHEIREQVERRVVHPLKTESVLIADLVGKDSPEPALVDLLTDKKIDSRSRARRIAMLARSTA